MALRFRWIKDLGEITSKNNRMIATLPPSSEKSFRGLAGELEKYMKSNAPWNDRTGDARSGLRAEYTGGGTLYRVELYHTVPYGKFLEFGTVNMSPRPILRPTLDSGVQVAATAMGVVIRETFGA
jgi:HK97 gp10 family phage protein